MKHPFWILNSSLTLLLVSTLFFMIFFRQEVPYQEPLEPEISEQIIPQDAVKINISKIYENDIFDTYQKKPDQQLGTIKNIPLPPPPRPSITKVPEIPKIEFLDPLNISLKGIIIISDNETKNRALIQDNETKKENTYKVGNMISDAQLIRIFSNKVILLRSNGQQEVLYLREKDAETDPTYNAFSSWSHIIKYVDDYYHLINPTAFISRVQNLSQFIDLLDLTTAYQKGQSIGCRVGTVKKDSLGSALGFHTGDIIIAVNNIPATNTPHRFQIYKELIAKKPNEPILVKILREHTPITLVYALEEFSNLNASDNISPAQELEIEETMKEKQLKALQQKPKFNSTTQDLKKRERQNMLSRGKMPLRNKPTQTV